MFTQLREILYTDSQDVLVLSSTIAQRYYNCCIDGSTNPGNYAYPPRMCEIKFQINEKDLKSETHVILETIRAPILPIIVIMRLRFHSR
jgi:hypothetical protein